MKIKTIGDISSYEAKSVGIFTTRQLLFIIGGVSAAIGVFVLTNAVLPIVLTTLISTLAGLAIAAMGFIKLGGMPLFDVLKRVAALALGYGKRIYMKEEAELEEE